MIVASDCCLKCGIKAAVRCKGAIKFVAMVASMVSRSAAPFRFSGFMMPAMLTSTLSFGYLATMSDANVAILAVSWTSSTSDAMPGLAAVTASSVALRRPAMMTVLPSL